MEVIIAIVLVLVAFGSLYSVIADKKGKREFDQEGFDKEEKFTDEDKNLTRWETKEYQKKRDENNI